MGVRDALLLNQTGSNFQALQTDDTARLKGDLSLQKDDGTEVLGIDVSTATLNLSGGITGSGNISSSLSSTGSFGRVVATTFHGDGSALKDDLPRSVGIVTQSAQLAAQISGAFTEGFFFSSSISGGMGVTGSFGKVEASFFFGDGSGVAQTIPRQGLITSSGQLADDISGSFNKGFEFSGAITAGDAVWAAGGCLIQHRLDLGARGTVNSALVAGGLKCNYPGTTAFSCTEEWNGTTFSEVNDMIDARTGDVGGTVNDAYFGGGNASINTEQWNGTNWSEAHSMPTSTANQHMGGNTPSELYFIMTNPAPGNGFSDYNTVAGTVSNCTAIPYTSGWYQGFQSHHGDMSAGIVSAGWGTSAAPLTNTATVVWNGTAWSDCGDILLPASGRAGWRNARQAGSVNAGVFTGGESGPPGGPSWANQCVDNAHQGWDGTTWSTKAQLSQPVHRHAATGTSNATFIVGGIAGHPGPPYSHMRSGSFLYEEDMTLGSFGRLEFISASGDATGLQSSIQYETNPAFNVLTGSSQIASRISGSFNKGFEFVGQIKAALGGVFASSTDFPDHWVGAGGGSMLAGTAIVAGGAYGAAWPPQATDNTALYDGSSWSEVNNLTSGTRSANTIALAGDASAGIFFGHCAGPSPTEEWNGTNWTEVADIPDSTATGAAGGGESSESAIWVGYFPGTTRGNKWDGTSWSEINNTNICRYDAGGTGTRDNFMIAGGVNPFCDTRTCTEIYNGTNWSETGAMIIGTYEWYSMGQTNDAIFAGGRNIEIGGNNSINCSQTFDGSAWAMGPNIVTQRFADSGGSKYSGPAAAGATNQAWFGGGNRNSVPYNSADTEVFPGFVISGSFGRIDANTFHGDGSNLSNLPFPTGLVTGSAQIASRISGSFTSGFTFSGEISGSVTSTGSFGRIEADFLHGDGSSIKDSLPRSTGIVSGAAQIAADISGSFTSGFGYEGTIKTKPSGWDSWATHQSMITGRAALGGKGNRNAAIAVAGTTNYAAPHSEAGLMGSYYYSGVGVSCTEEWNGTSWTEVNDMIDSGPTGYGGTTEAGYAMGRLHPLSNQTEEWNGTNWSEGPNVNAGSAGRRSDAGGCSPSQIYLIGGYGSNGQDYFTTFDGSSFTAEPGMTSVYQYGRNGHSGNASSALAWSSSCRKGNGDCTNLWDGTSWTEVAALPKIIDRGTGAGTVNDSYAYGGRCATEGGPTYNLDKIDTFLFWDGTAWSERDDYVPTPTASPAGYPRYGAGHHEAIGVGAGSSDIFVFGGREYVVGNDHLAVSASLMYNVFATSASFHNIEVTSLTGDGSQFSASLQSQLLTSVTQISNSISGSFTSGFDLQGAVSSSFGLYGDAWSVGGAVIDRARAVTGWGTVDAAIKAGGTDVNTSVLTANEEWNGALWSEIADMPTKRKRGAGSGTVNAGLYAGGTDGGFGGYTEASEVYIWNGLTWTETLDLPNLGDNHTGHGFTQDSALVTHGAPQYASNNADEWDGTTWTEKTANITSRGNGQGGGGTNAAHIVGGYKSSPYGQATTETECWNGSAWSQEANTNICHYLGFYAGITNDAHVGLNWGPPNITNRSTEIYNGLSWATTAPTIYSCGDGAASGRTGVGTSQGGTHKFGGGWVYGSGPSEIFNSSPSTGSFGQLRGTVGGEIKTDMFNITSSTFKLPLFSDADLNYNSLEPEESTGSISGSVVRAGDVNVLNKPGNFFFHSDYNALGFTYLSASVYSQSIDFVRCGYASGSFYTASSAFVTQSHYCYHNVIQYITGSYT